MLEITTPSGKGIPIITNTCAYNALFSLMTVDNYNWSQTGYELNAIPLKFTFQIGKKKVISGLKIQTIINKLEVESLNKVVLFQKIVVPKYFSIALPSTVMENEIIDIELCRFFL